MVRYAVANAPYECGVRDDLGGEVSTNTLIRAFLFFDILSNGINRSTARRQQTTCHYIKLFSNK